MLRCELSDRGRGVNRPTGGELPGKCATSTVERVDIGVVGAGKNILPGDGGEVECRRNERLAAGRGYRKAFVEPTYTMLLSITGVVKATLRARSRHLSDPLLALSA